MAKNVYVISYQGSKSAEIREVIKSMGAWFGHFENQHLVSTTWTIQQVIAALDAVVAQKQDRLLIMRVDVLERTGWLTPQGWDWLNKQLP